MPSNELIIAIQGALQGAGEPFRSAVATTIHQVEKVIGDQKESQSEMLESAGAELGMFADGRIDVAFLTTVVPRGAVVNPAQIPVMERALGVLKEVRQTLKDVHHLSVGSGQSGSQAVQDSLRRLGLAFGAARAVDLVKSGGYQSGKHGNLLQGVPFRKWTKAERQITPPLLLDIEGSDLFAAGLAEFLDGGMKFIIVPRTPCSPAPLVRLITPRTFVLQSHDVTHLGDLLAWTGPGIALVGTDCACFTHNPTAGSDLQAKLTVEFLPPNPRHALGGISVRQQLEELEQLRALASMATIPAPAMEKNSDQPKTELPPDPADKLAAWLLNQARNTS